MKRLVSMFFLCSFFFYGLSLIGQTANGYSFTSSVETYTEISGGTILGSTTSDDQVFNNNTTGQTPPQTNTGFPIGFNFTYRGIVYDRFAVNNNGWIVLGTGSFQISASSGNYTPISTTGPAGFVNAIAALGRDIQGQTGSELSYKTEGTAPDRYLVVQWKGYRKYAASGDNFNFQIRLYETSNIIKFVYGSFTVNATSSTPQVGIRGATSGDFHSRTTTTDWSNTAKSTLASSTCTLSSTVKPANGLTFAFQLLSPGSISGFVYDYNNVALGGATVAISGGSSTISAGDGSYSFASLSVGNYTLNCSKTGYNPASANVSVLSGTNTVQNFTLNNPEIAVSPGSISTILVQGQTGNFPITITNNGNGPLNWFVSLAEVAPGGYCANASTVCDEFISQVTFGSINKISGCEKYADFTNLSATVVPGNSYNMTVKIGPPSYSGDYVRVWIDWNRDGSFLDETPVQLAGALPNLSGNIAVPANASVGLTRMRVYLTYNIFPGPCTPPSNTWGEVEDYTVVVMPTWLSFSSYSGTVPPFGGTGSPTVSINTASLEPGVYGTNLLFNSDPSVGTVTVPVSFTVADPNLTGPENLRIDAINTSEGKLRLMWDYWADAVLDHYMIVRDGETVGTTNKTQFIDTVVEGEYCYKVYGVYDDGRLSPPSEELCLNFPLDPRIPVAGWALALAAGLIVTWTFVMLRRRS